MYAVVTAPSIERRPALPFPPGGEHPAHPLVPLVAEVEQQHGVEVEQQLGDGPG